MQVFLFYKKLQKKVKDDAYDSIEDYEADIELMVNNAKEYHGEMSLITELGRDLLSVRIGFTITLQYYYDLKKQFFGQFTLFIQLHSNHLYIIHILPYG